MVANLVQQATRFLHSGRPAAARSLFAALTQRGGDRLALDDLEARLCLAEGNLPRALVVLGGAIDRDPTNPGNFLQRAEVRARIDDLFGAAQDAATAVILAPGEPRAKAMLGLILIELGCNDDAIACLRDAVHGAPTQPAPWRGLAEALRRRGELSQVDAVFDAAIVNIPRHSGLRVAAMMHAVQRADYLRVVTLGNAARVDGVADACCFGLLGHALSNLGQHTSAAEAYQDALRLAPEDPYVRHLVRAAGLLPDTDQPPAEYLETVFDGYAGRFEQHLICLGYRIPGVVQAVLQEMLARTGNRGLGRVLDLGCGTGLIGAFLTGLPMADMTGIDISGAMLNEARGKPVYDRLVQGEIGAFLATTVETWDTVIAADVFCYNGRLDTIICAVARHLRPGGHVVFTVEHDVAGEASDGRGWRLGAQARYRHTLSYVDECLQAAALDVVELRDEVIRLEGGADVAGRLVLARKARCDV
jgi:predicted TPR repeat methyltransferase